MPINARTKPEVPVRVKLAKREKMPWWILLQEVAARDGAIIINGDTILTTADPISFKCACGNIQTRTVTGAKRAMQCDKCAYIGPYSPKEKQ